MAKFAPNGSLIYATYLGGSGVEQDGGIAVDGSGNAYVTGQTTSTDFPTTPTAFQASNAGNTDVFVSVLNATGSSLLSSTYLGGGQSDSPVVGAIALDGSGNVYVAGATGSTDFPLADPIQGVYGGGAADAFVVKLNNSLSTLVYSTYLGGADVDVATSVAADSAGNAYVNGYTASSSGFPLQNAAQGTYGGGTHDAFVARISPPNSAPTASGVNITGTPVVGQTLTGAYTYSDTENDAEGTSTFRWVRDAVTTVGTNLTYAPVPADAGHSIAFEVTPVALHGASPGTAVASSPVTVLAPPAITSAASTTFTTGISGNFSVIATGYPAATFTKAGALPSGVSLSASGQLSGIPGNGTGGIYNFTITASNGVLPDATQNFVLTVNQAPAITSAASTTIATSVSGTFSVIATGYPAATFTKAGALPSGVSLSASGQLSGMPGKATGGIYNFTITASNGVLPNATQTFVLTVNQAPEITSANKTTFNFGKKDSFTVKATGFPAPTLSQSGAPAGVTFNAGTGVLSANGTTPKGTYALTFTASSGVGSNAVQSFTLTVK